MKVNIQIIKPKKSVTQATIGIKRAIDYALNELNSKPCIIKSFIYIDGDYQDIKNIYLN